MRTQMRKLFLISTIATLSFFQTACEMKVLSDNQISLLSGNSLTTTNNLGTPGAPVTNPVIKQAEWFPRLPETEVQVARVNNPVVRYNTQYFLKQANERLAQVDPSLVLKVDSPTDTVGGGQSAPVVK